MPEISLELQNTVYALDSTTIDLCLSLFLWAAYCKSQTAVKLRTLMDLRGSIPSFIEITDNIISDVNIMDNISLINYSVRSILLVKIRRGK